MAIADKSKIAIISGKDEADINDLWVTLADSYIQALLNRDFSGTKTGSDYLDIRRINDFYTEYTGVRKFAISKCPLKSVDEVTVNPDSSDPETLVEGTDYFIDLAEGTLEFADDFIINLGLRKYKIDYTYGFDDAPDIVKDFANYWAAFMLESDPAKSSDSGAILKEVQIGRYKESYATASTALKAKYSILYQIEPIIINLYKDWDIACQ
jgi:hypothetical protein